MTLDNADSNICVLFYQFIWSNDTFKQYFLLQIKLICGIKII